jgi:hypothetical protein
MPEPIEFDQDAAAGFAAATAQAAALLATAAGYADTASAADLGGLGALGAGFATVWKTAAATQAATIRTAVDLYSAYGQTVIDQGAALAATDDTTAAALAAAAEEGDQ